VTAIQRNSQHLLHLVNDVLDLSQVESGRMALSQGWADAKQILEEASAVVKSLFDSKGLYLTLEMEEDIPPIFCDRTRIRQVVINLLSNAGRFTPSGGVCIRGRVEKEFLVVSVADTGPGIPEEDQLRIFEPFQQADNSIRRQFGGSGLGLTISKQFIEMHGGKMWLESHAGQGTTFFFSLPLASALGEGQSPHAQNARRALIPGDEFGYRVRTRPSKASVPVLVPRLVVFEKEQGLERLLRRYLENTEILRVDTIMDAVEELNRSPAQALVVNLPPTDEAAEFNSAVQSKIPFGTPVISCWIPGEVEAARQLGVVQYLVKPLTREKLLTILGELPIPGGPRTILVADDEPDELHLFARMLESDPNGYQVLQVTNGKRALNMMRSRHPDLVLLDLVMPVMDGFQVLEVKQKDPAIRDIPVIVISSRDPAGEAITGNTLKVSYNSGFSTTNLLAFIEAVTQIFTSGQTNHRQV
jgi:CheY-like chemotaxis protein